MLAAGLIAVRFAYLQYNILEMSYKKEWIICSTKGVLIVRSTIMFANPVRYFIQCRYSKFSRNILQLIIPLINVAAGGAMLRAGLAPAVPHRPQAQPVLIFGRCAALGG